MKKSRKIFGWIAALLMLLPLLLGGMLAQASNNGPVEQPEQVKFTLHKLVFDKMPTELPNNGENQPAFDQTGTPLKGATFKLYDVTKGYDRAVTTVGQDKALQYMQDNWNANWMARGNAIDEGTTNDAGIAEFNNIDTKIDGRNRVLMFIETDSPHNVTEWAAPMIVVLPVMKGETDEYLENIHLYPKNLKAEPTKEVVSEKAPAEGYIDFEIGKEIDYQIKVPIPSGIAETNLGGTPVIHDFTITDTPAEGLAYVDGSVKVMAGTQEELQMATDFTFTPNGTTKGWSLELKTADEEGNANSNLLNRLKAAVPKEITVTYKMVITPDSTPGLEINNEAFISISGKDDNSYERTVTPPVTVGTGGQKFKKLDGTSETGLAGAEFYLMNAKNEYASFHNSEGIHQDKYDTDLAHSITWVDSKDDATKIISTTETFKITGLEFANYKLEEVKAPDGYVLPTDGKNVTEFKVEKGSFETTSLKGIPNTKKGVLPATGGMGILLFLAAGSAMMSGAYVWYRKSKNQLEV